MKTIMNAFRIFIFSLLVSQSFFAQNITTTIGTNGTFSIKNSSTNYLTLSQSTGQVNILKSIELASTLNSATGVIYKGNNRFLHTYGNENTFLGENSGNFSLTGMWNTAIGYSVLSLLTNGHSNTAFGHISLGSNTTGAENSAFGTGSLTANTIGVENSAFGYNALRQSQTDSGNSAFGHYSLGGVNSGPWNSAFGFNTLFFNTSGQYNSAFGSFSLYNNSTGSYNTCFGYNSGSTITTGSNLICLGYNSQPSSGSATNQITLGNSSVTVLRSTQTTIASLSDKRDKKNIKDLTLGLDFLMTLKPRQYNWDKREWYENGISDGTKMQETQTAGFIAQELDSAQVSANAEWLNLVLKDNPEKWEATPGNLFPVVVKAVQELKTESDCIKNISDELEDKDKEFQERLSKFEQMQNILAAEVDKMKSNIKEVKDAEGGENKNAK